MISSINDQLLVFRDDLFPFLGGGNKGRKIKFIEKDILKKRSNAVVTTGGIQSNHCRALAILAAQNGWKCTLILHGNKEDFERANGNALIMRLSGARIVFSDPSTISQSMDDAIEYYKQQNLNPYYLWGGGHTLEGGLAYIEAIKELREYCENHSWFPDYIFLASGTGSTQAGILAGLDKYDISSEVIGISVARNRARAEEVVKEFYEKLCFYYKIPCKEMGVTVLDNYLCGGYDKYNEELREISKTSLKKYGIALDITYSGKAFYGMQEFIKENHIKSNVLFWHTGGIFNFLAQKT